MKKVSLLFIALLFSMAGFSQNIIKDFGTATDFFKSMQEARFEDAQNFFDESVKTKISADDLKNLWTTMNTQMGKAVALTPVRSQTQGEYIVITVEGEFERDKQNFTLAFNKEDKMVGFLLQPKSNVQAYLTPAYADTTKYKEQQIYIETPKHQLAGIVTTPKNVAKFPIVILVHDSGSGDMDESVGPNKPFKDIAAGLAAKGIGSVRYVKRTLLYSQEFDSTFTVKEEVFDDALAAINLAKQVKGVNPSQIYLFGYGLGGMLAPRIAGLSPSLTGLIIAAAPARKMPDLLIEQNKYLYGMAKDTTQAMKARFDEVIGLLSKAKVIKQGSMKPDSIVAGLPASYWMDLNAYDQVATAKALKKPRMMIVQGGNDFQVSKADYDLWVKALTGKKGVAFKFYPTLNHLMSVQTEKGTGAQYGIAANVSEALIGDISAWINQK
jgi:dienelactone hydrolase